MTEDADGILARRARRLARPARPVAPAEPLEVVTFVRHERRYALGARQVRGVVSLDRMSPLPRGGPAVLGLAVARGGFVTVLDLAQLLGAPGVGTPGVGTPGRLLLLLDHPALACGIAVDQVADFVSVDPGRVRPAAAALWGVLGELLLADDSVLLLDADALVDRYIGNIQRGPAHP